MSAKKNPQLKQYAISIRKKGATLIQISQIVGISKSTASNWVQGIQLRKKHHNSINLKKANVKRQNNKQKVLSIIEKRAKTTINKVSKNRNTYKTLCSFLFWAEGGKTESGIAFTNSDPKMIYSFLTLLRKGFSIKETKFRAILHLHEYHNENELIKFWSKITSIPKSQFYRSYKKPNTGKRKKRDYKGCIRVNYYDWTVARELKYIYNSYANSLLGASVNGKPRDSKSRTGGSIPSAPAIKKILI